jgi:dolichyl-diphosphooligosaccharide--protein glycosyltransferase
MELPKISKESVVNGLKSVGKLRVKIDHSSILTFTALLLILFISFTVRVFPLRWEIPTGAVHLSEFDPYYQYSLTNYMVKNGLLSPYWPTQWVDTQRWYPGGINMGQSLSSLPMTATVLYELVTVLGVNIDLMTFCSLYPAIMGTLSVLIIYYLGKDLGGKSVGMFAALFLALNASVIQRTSLGFFDTETVGCLALPLFSLLFLRANEGDRSPSSAVKYSLGAALALAYFIMGWGAAYYLIGLTVLFVFVLLLLKRYTQRLFMTYSLTFGLALLISMSNPDISTNYLTSYAVLPVAGVFVLLCLSEIIRNLTSAKGKVMFVLVFLSSLFGGFVALWQLGLMQNIAGKFMTIIDPFIRENNPLVESVAEHRITSWGSIYYDVGIGIVFFAVGLFFVARNLTNKNVFLLIFGLTSLYFASSMVRLLFIFASAFSILAAIGIVGVLKPFITLLKEPPKIGVKKRLGLEHVGREYNGIAVFLIFIILMTNFAFSPQSGGIPKVYTQAYVPVTITAGSLPIAPNAPVTEWLDMLKYLNDMQNSSIVVCSWWDYGYWLTILGNVTSLADNATINGTQIENIGFTFMADETQAVKMLSNYNAKYILVFTTLRADTGAWQGYGDEGKWMWMARISGSAYQRFIDAGLLDNSTAWQDETKFGNFTDNQWTWYDFGKNTTIYKLMADAKHQWWLNFMSSDDTDFVAAPDYFKPVYIAGANLSPTDSGNKYGGIVPLVALFEIDYQKYNNP